MEEIISKFVKEIKIKLNQKYDSDIIAEQSLNKVFKFFDL